MKPRLKGGSYFAAPASALQFVSTGAVLLDCVIGGGWPLSRVANIVGDKSTGKTLLAIEACANFSRAYNGDIRYNEPEAAFDRQYATTLGLPKDRLEIVDNCNTVEEFYDDLIDFVKGRHTPGLYILDSLDALSDAAEMDRDIKEGTYGAQKAKKMSELFRRTVRTLKTSNVCLIVISQVRDNIGVSFGEKHSRTGGRALDFYASQVLYLAQVETLKKTIDKVMRPIGVKIRAKCKKNKVALPGRECDFSIMYGYGVEDVASGLEWLDSIGKLDEFSALKPKRFQRNTEDKKASGRIQRYVSGLDKSALTEARKEVDALVTKHWYRIETEFLPTRSKYG